MHWTKFYLLLLQAVVSESFDNLLQQLEVGYQLQSAQQIVNHNNH